MNGHCPAPKFFSTGSLAALLALGLCLSGTCTAQSGGSANSASSESNPKNAQDAQSDVATTRLKILVTNSDGKPVGNASVYVRFGETGGFLRKDKLAELSFKTNDDGTVKVPNIPVGKVLIQVIAKGLHTYGKWYDIAKNPDTIEIKLDHPTHWY